MPPDRLDAARARRVAGRRVPARRVQHAAHGRGDPVRGAALASAATIIFSPSFHPWYVVFPLVLFAATTRRTTVVMTVTIAASFLVLPDGGGLARFAKFPGAPLMTVLLIFVAVRRLPAAIRGARRLIGARHLRDVA
jgi:hypothetical protein